MSEFHSIEFFNNEGEGFFISPSAIVARPHLGVRLAWHGCTEPTSFNSLKVIRLKNGIMVTSSAEIDAAKERNEFDDWTIPVILESNNTD